MRPVTRLFLLASLLLLPASSLRAQTPVDPTGHWEGAVQMPNMEIRIEIDLVKNGQGELAGTFGNPTQNLKGLLLSNFAVDGKSVSFQIKGAPGERTFKCAFSADGKTMFGDYSQAGHTIPFSVTRTGDARIDAPARSASVGKELEGTWNATLEAKGVQRQLVLTLSNQPDATVIGSILNVDEGLEIPIAAITQKASSLTLELKAVGGSYSGALNPEGSELIGTWTQGPAAMPLTFRRGSGIRD